MSPPLSFLGCWGCPSFPRSNIFRSRDNPESLNRWMWVSFFLYEAYWSPDKKKGNSISMKITRYNGHFDGQLGRSNWFGKMDLKKFRSSAFTRIYLDIYPTYKKYPYPINFPLSKLSSLSMGTTTLSSNWIIKESRGSELRHPTRCQNYASRCLAARTDPHS